jgi:hypothetical protein
VPGTPDSEDWTPAAVPMARPAGRPRRGAERQTAAERVLKSALRFGLFVNAAALVLPRLLPARSLEWRYGADDFLLAAAVLLSGYGLLLAGRLSQRDNGGR